MIRFISLLLFVGCVIVAPLACAATITPNALPTLSIDDVSQAEGSFRDYSTYLFAAGYTNFVFTVTLSQPGADTVTVDAYTTDGSASRFTDYLQTAATLTFAPGETQRTITVPVRADFQFEPDEAFTVNLVNETNAALGKATGTGTILNDDPPSNPTDMQVTASTAQPVYVVGDSPTVTFTVMNGGPADSQDIEWVMHIARRNVIAITPSQGQCMSAVGGEDELFFCALGGLGSGQAATVTMTLLLNDIAWCPEPLSGALAAKVSSTTNPDPDTTNNVAVIPFTVLPVFTPTSMDIVSGETEVLTVDIGNTYSPQNLSLSVSSPCITAPPGIDTTSQANGHSLASIPITAVSAPCSTMVNITYHAYCTLTYHVTVSTHEEPNNSPLVTGVSPSTGTTAGGTLVRVSGQNLHSDCWLFFDGLAAHNVSLVGTTSLIGATPPHAAGTVAVSLRCRQTSGAQLTNAYTYLTGDDPAPLITSFDPSAAAPGQTVTINGLHFRPTDIIDFDSTTAPSVNTAPDAHVVIVPSLPPGMLSVNVADMTHRLSTTGPLFMILESTPQVARFSPAHAPSGAELTIEGSGFRSPYTFTIGGQAARLTAISYTRAVIRIPTLTPGTYELDVVNGKGAVATTGGSVVVTSSGLMVGDASPICTPSDGGGRVAILGSGFAAGATVTIGGTMATNVTVVDGSHITATLPALAPGRASIIVTNANGDSGTSTNAVVVYSPFDPDGCPATSRMRALRP